MMERAKLQKGMGDMSQAAVKLGALAVHTPVMLAPMAGVTNPPFRQLCREQAERALADISVDDDVVGNTPAAPGGLWVCEMVTTRALVERNSETMNMIKPDPGDPVRSIQLYGVEPKTTAEAVRILVAEDNDSNYMLVKVLLKGYNLTRACNGREAVELAGREKFDIILMDIRMPEMDGAEATRRIREFCPAIPIIAVTANAFDEDRRRAFEAGVDDFLTKPLSKAKLFETINRY